MRYPLKHFLLASFSVATGIAAASSGIKLAGPLNASFPGASISTTGFCLVLGIALPIAATHLAHSFNATAKTDVCFYDKSIAAFAGMAGIYVGYISQLNTVIENIMGP